MPSNRPILKKRLSKETKLQLTLGVSILLVLTALLVADIVAHGPLTSLLTNKDQIITKINSFGIFAPLAFILFSTIETIFAPIPGQIIGLIGGFLFGWWGILLNFIATGLGSLIVFALSRRFGRPLVEKLIKKETLDKFDYLTKEKGSLIFFLIFLIPGLPDDIVCYLAGLTEIPIKRLMFLVLLGRLPAIIMTNFIGSGLGESDITPIVIVSVITSILLVVLLIKRDKIMSALRSKQPPEK